MCGIAGIYKLDKSTVNKNALSVMTDVIDHRGPDGFGYWFNNKETLGLGHRRLSIIDLSIAGKQPMVYMGLTVTFNGEIYNYIEIKKDLEKKKDINFLLKQIQRFYWHFITLRGRIV